MLIALDTVDQATRSRIMRSVGQRGTGPEMALRRALHRLGLRYRLHDKRLPGSPDLVFPRFGAVVFVNGCFWHVHEGCRFQTTPSSRTRFWSHKFKANQRRDSRNYAALAERGWRVLVVWECAIKAVTASGLDGLTARVAQWLASDSSRGEIPIAASDKP